MPKGIYRNRYSIGAACLLLLVISGIAWAKGSVSSHDPVPVDYSCQVDADCVVKDVGNCCGYYPACVNVSAKTDPKGVQAQCEKDGMGSVCGFEEIQSCSCVEQRCVSAGSSLAQ